MKVEQRTGPRWKDQTTFYDPENPGSGNCTEACVASLLGLALNEVPKFWQSNAVDPVYTFWKNFDRFFARLGWEVHHETGGMILDGIYMVAGDAARGCSHMCLAQYGVIIHDPHPSRAGLLNVQYVRFISPLDPLDSMKGPEPDGRRQREF